MKKQQVIDLPIEQSGRSAEAPENKLANGKNRSKAVEYGGPKGPEPTRYGDWEQAGRCTDF